MSVKSYFLFWTPLTLSPLQTALLWSKTINGRVHWSYLVLKGLKRRLSIFIFFSFPLSVNMNSILNKKSAKKTKSINSSTKSHVLLLHPIVLNKISLNIISTQCKWSFYTLIHFTYGVVVHSVHYKHQLYVGEEGGQTKSPCCIRYQAIYYTTRLNRTKIGRFVDKFKGCVFLIIWETVYKENVLLAILMDILTMIVRGRYLVQNKYGTWIRVRKWSYVHMDLTIHIASMIVTV